MKDVYLEAKEFGPSEYKLEQLAEEKMFHGMLGFTIIFSVLGVISLAI